MLHKLALVFAIGVFASSTATAQTGHGQKKDAPSKETTKALVGVWEGSFQTDHAPPGNYRLTIAYDSAWKVTSDVNFDNQPMATTVSNFKGDGNRLSWTQDLMGGSCEGAGVVEKDTLKGNVTCGHGAMTVTLVRK